MNPKQAELFMKQLGDVAESSGFPICIAVSVGIDDFFVVRNSAFDLMNQDDIVFCGMSNCLNKALLDEKE